MLLLERVFTICTGILLIGIQNNKLTLDIKVQDITNFVSISDWSSLV